MIHRFCQRVAARKNAVLIGFLFLFSAEAATSQSDALSAMQRITGAYQTQSALRFSGKMIMYRKGEPHRIIETMSAKYLIQGNNVSCTFGPMQILMNSDYYVSVDNSIRIMVVGRNRDLAATGQLPVLNIGKLKEWVAGNKISATLVKEKAEDVVELSDSRQLSGFSRYRIRFTPAGFLTSVVMETSDYHSNAGPVMVLEVNYSKPAVIESSRTDFSERTFFSLYHNRPRVAAKFTGYQVINQL